MTSWTIRSAVPADLPMLSEIYRAASLANPRDEQALLAHPDALVLGDQSISEGRMRVALGADGLIVGFATPLFRDDVMEIEDLFVEPRWQRRGIARRLVEDLIANAHRRGVRRAEVVANPHAVAFYQRVGFVQDGETRTRFGPAPLMSRALS
jgi:GNAT superfamily N-acetyltransferase